MEGKELSKTGEPKPLSLSQILLSTTNPIVSSTKAKSSSPQVNKRPVGPASKYEFVQIFPDNPKKHGSRKKMRRVADMGSNNSKTSSRAVELPPEHPCFVKAKEVEASLSHERPSFIKEMQQSNVGHPFFLRLPREFCRSHLPTGERTLLVLEDENGKQYKTKYLARWSSLSGGWKHFSVSKNLLENDVMVFHLVEPCKFKVYILRKSDFDPVDGDPMIPKSGEINLEEKRRSEKLGQRTFVETSVSEDNAEANNSTAEDYNLPTTADVRFSKTISSFRNFKIIIDCHRIDSGIPKHTRASYFILCRTRKTLLHHRLIKGIGSKLAASIISETTNIADAIRNSEMSTPREDIAYWNTALQSFEFFGMDVGFIRARLNRLLDIARDCSKVITDMKKNENIDLEAEGARIEDEIREHENKIAELKSLKRRVEMRGEESVNEIVDKCKTMYKEEAKAPW